MVAQELAGGRLGSGVKSKSWLCTGPVPGLSGTAGSHPRSSLPWWVGPNFPGLSFLSIFRASHEKKLSTVSRYIITTTKYNYIYSQSLLN